MALLKDPFNNSSSNVKKNTAYIAILVAQSRKEVSQDKDIYVKIAEELLDQKTYRKIYNTNSSGTNLYSPNKHFVNYTKIFHIQRNNYKGYSKRLR
jgi:hypothetical protein